MLPLGWHRQDRFESSLVDLASATGAGRFGRHSAQSMKRFFSQEGQNDRPRRESPARIENESPVCSAEKDSAPSSRRERSGCAPRGIGQRNRIPPWCVLNEIRSQK